MPSRELSFFQNAGIPMNTKWLLVLGLACLLSSGSAKAGSDAKSQVPPTSRLQNSSGDPETTPEADAHTATLEAVKVRPRKDDIGFEIRTDRPVTPTPLVLTDPDRLVLDFPNTV